MSILYPLFYVKARTSEILYFFPDLPEHRDGSRWIYWAEEVEIEEAGRAEQASPT